MLARARPTTPQRLGPTLVPPPFSKVWQAWQTLAESSPRLGSAVARSCAIGGSCWAGACSLVPPASFGTTMLKPGLAGISGANIAPEAIFSATTTRAVPRIAPRTLFISNESIVFGLRTKGLRRQLPEGQKLGAAHN